jgi:hypothetical protein
MLYRMCTVLVCGYLMLTNGRRQEVPPELCYSLRRNSIETAFRRYDVCVSKTLRGGHASGEDVNDYFYARIVRLSVRLEGVLKVAVMLSASGDFND